MWENSEAIIKERISELVDDDSVPRLRMTTNEQALLCISKQDFEEDTVPAIDLKCPLLENGCCLCYESRPLMCRMMFSSIRCGEAGHAEMPSRLLSLNSACLQLMEHLDWSYRKTYAALQELTVHELLTHNSAKGRTPRLFKATTANPNRPELGLVCPDELERLLSESVRA